MNGGEDAKVTQGTLDGSSVILGQLPEKACGIGIRTQLKLFLLTEVVEAG